MNNESDLQVQYPRREVFQYNISPRASARLRSTIGQLLLRCYQRDRMSAAFQLVKTLVVSPPLLSAPVH